jgi:hypothetical protein
MKRFYTPVILALFWCGCMNVNEDIDINANGGGTYSEEIDLSSLMAFISAASSMDSSSAAEPSSMPDMDSSFSLKQYADTSTSLTAEEKKLMQDASMKIVSNQANNVFKIKLIFPFNDMQQLEKLTVMNSGQNSMNLLMKGTGMNKSMQPSDDKKMPDLTSVYTVTCSKGVIDKKMDEEKWKAMQQDEQIIQMQQSGEMMKAYVYTTTIHLPSPVKKLAGDKAALSSDKKTVIVQGSVADMANHPEAFTYHIEY